MTRFSISAISILALTMAGAVAHADTTATTALVQAEAQANLARAMHSATNALDRLDGETANPVPVVTPKHVMVVAPQAPADPPPKIDLARMPVDLRRPVTIRWNGTLQGAVGKIATQMNYKVEGPAKAFPTPETIALVKHKVPAAIVLQDIGARISSYAKLQVDPGTRTITIINISKGA